MRDQKTAKEYIQDARVKLMDKFGLFGGGHELNEVFDSLNKAYDMSPASSPITRDKELVLKTRIEERKLCVYLIEQDLMDHENGTADYSKEYTSALFDEIENHKNYIAEYEEERVLLTQTTKEG